MSEVASESEEPGRTAPGTEGAEGVAGTGGAFPRGSADDGAPRQPDRERRIVRTSYVGVAVNVGLVVAKALVGLAAGSLAIVLDAVNNLTDAASSVVTIVGVRMAAKPADREHPFGHGRIEYLSAMGVAAIVMGAGASSLIESARKLLSPSPATYDGATILVLVMATVVKVALGLGFRRVGRESRSESLEASGADALFDALISLTTLFSAVVQMTLGVDLDGILGAAIALVIVRSGYQMFLGPLNRLLGTRQDVSFGSDIQRDVADMAGVLGVYDLTLHNYGPESLIGTLNVGVPDTMTAHEIGDLTHRISRLVRERYGVNLTVGIHAVNTSSPELASMERRIQGLAESYLGVRQVHGIYIDPKDKDVSLDVILDFDVADASEVGSQIRERLEREYPGYRVVVDVDRDYGE